MVTTTLPSEPDPHRSCHHVTTTRPAPLSPSLRAECLRSACPHAAPPAPGPCLAPPHTRPQPPFDRQQTRASQAGPGGDAPLPGRAPLRHPALVSHPHPNTPHPQRAGRKKTRPPPCSTIPDLLRCASQTQKRPGLPSSWALLACFLLVLQVARALCRRAGLRL